jgi:hypothetical protein
MSKKKTTAANNTNTNTNKLETIIASLKDLRTCLLIVDTKMCKHSQRLLEEVKISTGLSPSGGGKGNIMHILDIDDRDLDTLPWLPGVPVLLFHDKIHMELDAFSKCRELCRADDGQGYTLQTLSL